MPIKLSSVDFKQQPKVPRTGLVAISPQPCLRERTRALDELAKALGIKVAGSGDVPHGFAVGGPNGQVELFAASGAVRARNTDQYSRFKDERRPWADIIREQTQDGIVYGVGAKTAKSLQANAQRILDSCGLAVRPASVKVAVGQWAKLDEKGKELEAGPGRATVQYAYAVEGIPLIGAGAKTNVHFDPDDRGSGGVIARFFHVHRGLEGTKEVRLLDLEQALEPLLSQTWSGMDSKEGQTRITITVAEFGLLALPADVPQRFAAPALRVEGTVTGLAPRGERDLSIRFGQYLPLVSPKGLEAAGLGSVGPVIPAQVVAGGRDRGE